MNHFRCCKIYAGPIRFYGDYSSILESKIRIFSFIFGKSRFVFCYSLIRRMALLRKHFCLTIILSAVRILQPSNPR